MSMEVDYSTPLTSEERAYLESRGKLSDIERADNAHGIEGYVPGSGDGSGLIQKSVISGDVVARRKQELQEELARIEAQEREAAGDVETDDDVPDYSAWKPEELRSELSRRELSSSGTKPQMVQRLQEDDAAYAAQEQASA
jgi:SAP domain-containing protein